jgi:CzcA family heavy metal efflux pump
MLSAIVRFALRFRGVIFALAAIACGYGLFSLTRAKLDVFPEFAPPTTVVQTEAPGLSSEQVETLVTQTIENELGGALSVKSMRSKSLQGLSVVTLIFDDGTDVVRARQLVSERLSGLASSLPTGVQAPKLLPLTTTTSVVLVAGITSEARSLMALHDAAEWTIKPQLLDVPGVADAIVFGGEARQFQIQVEPSKLVQYGLAINDVIKAARAATGVRGAGFIEDANQRITLNTVGQVSTPTQLANAILNWKDGIGIKIGDVAKVTYAPAFPVGAASIMSKPGVMIVVESQYGADTLSVTKGLEQRLEELRPALTRQGITLHPDIFRPAKFIRQATTHLGNALLLGAVLVICVLFLFLLNVRTAFISAVAIPLSLLVAVIALNALGVTLNTMTLGGLAIALGEVVDDAIIDVENIYRRLRENRTRAWPLPALQVVLRASLEVRTAVAFATFIVILIFLPVLSLPGVAGKLFAPLGIAYIFAVLASLAVALTLTPAMALALLGGRDLPPREPPMLIWLESRYRSLLAVIERRSRFVLVAVVVMCLAAAAALPFLRGSFIPQLREGHYIVHLGLAPGSSLAESMRIGTLVSRGLMKIPGVRLVAQRAGRADEVVDPVGVQLSEFEVDLEPVPAARQAAILQKIRDTLATFPGITTSINTFLVERIDETISGATAPLAVKVFGNNLDIIDQKAEQIAHLIGTIRGAASVRIESPGGIPEMSVRLKDGQLRRYGFRALDVLGAIQTAYEGSVVAQVYKGTRTYDVTVIAAPKTRANADQIGDLLIRNLDGKAIPLRQVADIRQASGRYQIEHDGGRRLQTILVNIGARTVNDFIREAKARVAANIIMPKGTYVIFSGEGAALSRSQSNLLAYGSMALLGIVVLLYFALRSSRAVLLVMANLPFALVGGVMSVLLIGGELSLGGMVGFVTLFGISLRNSIMLISHYEHLVYVENAPWGLDTAVRGASERLVPILMTALVTALGLLPLALTSGAAGNEIEGPMALVILGGLSTSTLLNLVVLPVLAFRYGRFVRATGEQESTVHAAATAERLE